MENETRIVWDTPVSDLTHSANLAYIDLEEDEIMHWKYIKREKVNGKWRYYYDKDELKNDVRSAIDKMKEDAKSTADSWVDSLIAKSNEASKKLNSVVEKAKELINKFYDDPDNKYDVTHKSYNEKIEKIKGTEEWKNIVNSKNSEYVKKNEDGSTSYLIDDYLVDKKHPILDAITDIASGREVSVNEITKESIVAGLKDYAQMTIELGALAANVLANGLLRKFKYSQGSYDTDIEDLANTVTNGADYVSSLGLSTTVDSINEIDLKKLVSTINSTIKSSAEAVNSVNEEKIVNAVKVIVESEAIKEKVGANEYYKQVQDAYSNLSEEEIELINLLLDELRG